MFRNIIQYLDRQKFWPLVDALLFALITWVFHKLWWMFSGEIYSVQLFTSIADWLAASVYTISAWIDRHILGMSITLYEVNIIRFNDNLHGIQVNESCSGFKQMYQVLVLFLLFPGPWKHKLWYIPAGIAAMFVTNIIRIVALSLIMLHWPAQWDFMHMWVLRPFYYVVIFILWVLWVEKFGGIKRYFRSEAKPSPGG